MAGKHTAGPWRSVFNSADTPECRCVEILGGQIVGSVAYLQSYTSSGYDDRDEVLANARLIAAAPDLLEVLDEILNYSGGAETALHDPYVIERAHAALAHATQPLPPQSEEV